MSRLPAVPAREVIRFLNELSFTQVRQRGSHKFFRHPDGRTATVADHRGEDLGRGLLRSLLRDIEVEPEEFIAWRG